MFKVCLVVFSMLISFPVAVRKLEELEGGMASSGSQSMGTDQLSRKVDAAGAWNSCSHNIHSQIAKNTECSRHVCAQFPFSVYLVQYPTQGMVLPMVDRLSHLR